MIYKIKILFLTPFLGIHIQRWADAFDNRGHEVHIICNNPLCAYGTTSERVKIHFIEKPEWSISNPFRWQKRQYRWIAHKIREIKPDVLHLHYLDYYGFTKNPLKEKPMIVSTWGSDIYDIDNALMRELKSRLIRNADKITATSSYLAKQTSLYSGYPVENIKVVPFGVDLNRFKYMPKTEKKGVFYLGTVKHLEPKYGIEYLIRTFPIILKSEKNTKLLIAGKTNKPDFEIELKKLSERLGVDGCVSFVGGIRHDLVPKFLSNLDIFIMPSINEEFGVSAVEAEAVGVPVVASNVGGIPEAVKNGETGILVEPKNPQAIADTVLYLIQNPEIRRKMGLAGRKYVEENFDWQKNVDEMERLYFEQIKAKEEKFAKCDGLKKFIFEQHCIPWRVMNWLNWHMHPLFMILRHGRRNINTRKYWENRWKTGSYGLVEEARMALFKKVAEKIPPGAYLLDVGCGDGSFIELLKDLYGIKSAGIDFSSEAIRLLKKKGLDGKVAASNKIPFPEGSFEVVASLELLEHLNIKNCRKTLAEMNRVCKKDGLIIITVPSLKGYMPQDEHEHLRVYSKNDIANLLSEHLTQITVEDSANYVYLIASGKPKKPTENS